MVNLELVSSKNKYNLLSGRVALLLNRFLAQQFKSVEINLTCEQCSVLAILHRDNG